MNKSVRFSLPISPSINKSYADVIKHSRQGKAYTKRVASEALEAFKQSAPLLMHQQGLIRGTWEGVQAVGYELTIYTRTDDSDACDYSPCVNAGASTDWIPMLCNPTARMFREAL